MTRCRLGLRKIAARPPPTSPSRRAADDAAWCHASELAGLSGPGLHIMRRPVSVSPAPSRTAGGGADHAYMVLYRHLRRHLGAGDAGPAVRALAAAHSIR